MTTKQEPTEGTKKAAATPVTVCDPGGHVHRVFSLEIHGDKYRDYADEYVASRPGWTVK